MKRRIPCFCDNTFSVEIPAEISLDENPRYLGEILDGSFLNFICPGCGKKHKPEFPLILRWPDRGVHIEVLPETERGEFYRRKKDPDGVETVIGYPEMAERIAVYLDRLVPAVIEVLKYHLLLRAEESWPDERLSVWYQNKSPPAGSGPEKVEAAGPEFHLHGFKSNEIAVSRLPLSLYEQTLADYERHPRGEIFEALRFRSYVSVQNATRQAYAARGL